MEPKAGRSEEEIERDFAIMDKRVRKWISEFTGTKADRPPDPHALDRIRARFAKDPYVATMTFEDLEDLIENIR